jgi:hypothetical protein
MNAQTATAKTTAAESATGAVGETEEQTLARWAAQDAAYAEADTHYQIDLQNAYRIKDLQTRIAAATAAREDYRAVRDQIAADYAPAGA